MQPITITANGFFEDSNGGLCLIEKCAYNPGYPDAICEPPLCPQMVDAPSEKCPSWCALTSLAYCWLNNQINP